MSTADRLADALAEANAPLTMVINARQGYYDDYRSPLAMPIHQLVNDCRGRGLLDIANRAIRGEFDATKEESDAWVQSPEGQAAINELGLPREN